MIENRVVKKAYRDKNFCELLKAPIEALSGLNKNDATYLRKAFDIHTIEDMANNKFFKAAEAIRFIAETERDLESS